MTMDVASRQPVASLHPAIGALRCLAAAGYLNQQQLSAMEELLAAKTKAGGRHGAHWLSLSEACRYATFSRTTLWKYCNAGLLAVRKLGRRRLIEQGELEVFILSGPPPTTELPRKLRRKKTALAIGLKV